MTGNETLKILAMLSAYYGQGKADPQAMASAWHVILKDYDYEDAEGAVIEFARQDQREYASFPTVGNVVYAIERYSKRYNRLINAVYNRKAYGELDDMVKRLVTEQEFNRLKAMDSEEFLERKDELLGAVKRLEVGHEQQG